MAEKTDNKMKIGRGLKPKQEVANMDGVGIAAIPSEDKNSGIYGLTLKPEGKKDEFLFDAVSIKVTLTGDYFIKDKDGYDITLSYKTVQAIAKYSKLACQIDKEYAI